MAKTKLVNLSGEKIKDIEVKNDIFNIKVNNIVLKKAIDLALASLRQGTHKTKTRSEVSGGGKKPYRQKGTGNARQGTIRAPHYRGGGVVNGPIPIDYTFKMNKKERVLALKSALSYKFQTKKMLVVDKLELSNLKTKEAIKVMNNLKLNDKTLFVTSDDNENLYMATRNINNVYVCLVSEINVLDLSYADTVVFEESSLKQIEEVLK